MRTQLLTGSLAAVLQQPQQAARVPVAAVVRLACLLRLLFLLLLLVVLARRGALWLLLLVVVGCIVAAERLTAHYLTPGDLHASPGMMAGRLATPADCRGAESSRHRSQFVCLRAGGNGGGGCLSSNPSTASTQSETSRPNQP
jgi:hypothetical protein